MSKQDLCHRIRIGGKMTQETADQLANAIYNDDIHFQSVEETGFPLGQRGVIDLDNSRSDYYPRDWSTVEWFCRESGLPYEYYEELENGDGFYEMVFRPDLGWKQAKGWYMAGGQRQIDADSLRVVVNDLKSYWTGGGPVLPAQSDSVYSTVLRLESLLPPELPPLPPFAIEETTNDNDDSPIP